MMRTGWFVVAALVAASCSKKEPKLDGLIRIAFGDCAPIGTQFVSGPRPTAFTTADLERAKTASAAKPDDPAANPTVTQGGAFASLSGSSGFDDTNIYGGLLGSDAGDMQGGFGFGRSGFGPGGGGTGWGTIGTGRYGTIGGTGSGYGVGGGRRGRGSAVPQVKIGQPNVSGDLDKAIIRRYVRRNIMKVQYCYEKELLAKPTLAGTVVATWTITPNGNVTDAQASGVDAEVSSCIQNVIANIEFPKPKGGGVVVVTYPFTLRPADGAVAAAGSATSDPVPPPAPPPPPPAPPAPKADPSYEPGASNPLRVSEPALVECFRKQQKRYGVAVIELAWDASKKVTKADVHGITGDSARTCMSNVAKKAVTPEPPGAEVRCSIAFGTIPPSELPGVDITADAVTWAGRKVGDPTVIAKDASPSFKIDMLFEQADAYVKNAKTPPPTGVVALVGPLVLRAIDATPMKVVNRAYGSLLAAGADDVLFAAQRDGSWRVLADAELPAVPVPIGTGAAWSHRRGKARDASITTDSERVNLSVLVTPEKIWVGLSRVNEFQEIPKLVTGDHDWDKLKVTLAEHKKSAFFADRSDLEVAGEDAVVYSDVVTAIELMREVGFKSYAVVDPMGLSARPVF